jgi:ABC-type uncharacterized transport system permease subunit
MPAHPLLNILFIVSVPFAIIGLLAFTCYVFYRKDSVFSTATITSLLAFVCLTLMLIGVAAVESPAALVARGNRYLCLAWMIMLTYFFVEYRYRIRLLGSILMPAAIALMLASFFSRPDEAQQARDMTDQILALHLSFVFMSFATLFVSFAGAVLFIIKTRALKDHRLLSIDNRLPPLTTLQKLMTTAFNIGFPLLTAGLLVGIIFASSTHGADWLQDMQVLIGIGIWVFYAMLFFMHHRKLLADVPLARCIIAMITVVVLVYGLSSYDRDDMPSATIENPEQTIHGAD